MSNTRSYHRSAVKTANRLFKLGHAKKALKDYAPLGGSTHWVYTLCGASAKFETELVKFGNHNSIKCHIFAFNNNPAEIPKARQKFNVLGQESGITSVSFDSTKFGAWAIYGTATFVDFDTCSWFTANLADSVIDITKRSQVLALTIIIRGSFRATHTAKLPAGFTVESIKDYKAIAAYITSKTGLEFVDSDHYKNTGAVNGMATLIFRRPAPKKSKIDNETRESIRHDITRFGEASEIIARRYGVDVKRVACIRAWLSGKLLAKRKQ
jgi:hypothetical protein